MPAMEPALNPDLPPLLDKGAEVEEGVEVGVGGLPSSTGHPSPGFRSNVAFDASAFWTSKVCVELGLMTPIILFSEQDDLAAQ